MTAVRRPQRQERFPIGPLAAELERRGYTTLRSQAAFFEVDGSLWYRWGRSGVRLREADRLAIRLGRHPSWFWPEYFDTTMDPIGDWEEL